MFYLQNIIFLNINILYNNICNVTGNSLDIDLPIGDVNSIIKKYSLKIWNEYWNKRALKSRARTYSLFYPRSQMSLGLKK